MKSIRFSLPVLSLLILSSVASFASAGSRGTSNNGTDNDAPFWNLFGPTATVSRYNGQVMLRTQVVCTNQQVASAVDAADAVSDPNAPFADAGSCKDGAYTFLYQIQSNTSNLEVVLSGLVGFTPVSNATTSTYGIESCDTTQNTLQLCSNVAAATTPVLNQLAKINATVSSKNTVVTFCIPKVPVFPANTSPQQGAGLTLVVVTQQTPGLPVSYPDITIK